VRIRNNKIFNNESENLKNPQYSTISKAKHIKFSDNENQTIESPSLNQNTLSNKRKITDDNEDDKYQSLMNEEMGKYWYQRYSLFSKFDDGIQMDKEGFYSVTPEIIAGHQARRCMSNIVIDAFCGVGGNAIQFAFTCERVIAIDNDVKKIEMAKNNARIYGVEDRIEFITGDFLKLSPHLKADVVFLSPPWGGPNYNDKEQYDLNQMTPNCYEIFKNARVICPNIAFFLPRNVNLDQVREMAEESICEVEENYINGKLKTVTVYFGELIQKKKSSRTVENHLEYVQ